MKLKSLFLASTLGVFLVPAIGYAQTARAALEAQMTAAGVYAVDEHWGEAERHGDTAYLNRLLLPGYQSVGPNGVAHSRSQIIAGAAKTVDPAASAKAVADSAAYVAAHPYEVSILLQGNTAVRSFYSSKPGPQKVVFGSDVLVYVDGHWHALYSQSSDVK